MYVHLLGAESQLRSYIMASPPQHHAKIHARQVRDQLDPVLGDRRSRKFEICC